MMKTFPALLALVVVLAAPACTKAAAPAEDPAPVATEGVVDIVPEQTEMLGRGEAIAEAACASCHAIGAEGDSPHADAPPFRTLAQVHDLATLAEDFEDGVVTVHPDMPHWQFEQIDITALVAYLESVQVPAGE